MPRANSGIQITGMFNNRVNIQNEMRMILCEFGMNIKYYHNIEEYMYTSNIHILKRKKKLILSTTKWHKYR